MTDPSSKPERALRFLLGLMGALMVGVGATFLFAPALLTASSGIELATPLARGDVRAVYGGMEVAIGVALLASARVRAWTQSGALLGVSVGVFAGLGRVLAVVADGATDGVTLGSLGADLSLAALLAFLAHRARRAA